MMKVSTNISDETGVRNMKEMGGGDVLTMEATECGK